jgi:multidrug resistance efflux pump
VKTGEANTLAATHNLSTIRGLDDREIQAAVEELKRSTAAIEKQTDALRAQQSALNTFVKSNAQNSQVRSQADKSQQRKWNVEKGQISAAVWSLYVGKVLDLTNAR